MHLLRIHLPVSASLPPRGQEPRSSRPRTRLGGGRPAPPAGAAPAPPASPLRLGAHLSPAPRAAASARLALRDSTPELSHSAGAPPFSPRDSASPRRFPPSPPPSPNSPASRRLRDATPVLRALGQRSPRTQQPAPGRTALPGSAQEGQSRPGAGRRRPPPAAPSRPPSRPPGKARLPAPVGHAVRCRLPSALTFAAEAVAEAAAAMFPC